MEMTPEILSQLDHDPLLRLQRANREFFVEDASSFTEQFQRLEC